MYIYLCIVSKYSRREENEYNGRDRSTVYPNNYYNFSRNNNRCSINKSSNKRNKAYYFSFYNSKKLNNPYNNINDYNSFNCNNSIKPYNSNNFYNDN